MPNELAIAVIEDNPSFRSALVESLCSLGYGARGFGSAEDFIAEGGEQNCDRIVTDIHMPGMSGIELKRLLAARGSTRPVVMVTGVVDPGLQGRSEGQRRGLPAAKAVRHGCADRLPGTAFEFLSAGGTLPPLTQPNFPDAPGHGGAMLRSGVEVRHGGAWV